MPRLLLVLCVATLASCTTLTLPDEDPVTPISRGLDGRIYDITVYDDGGAVDRSDALVFQAGAFHSTGSRKAKFAKTNYTTVDIDVIPHFTATATSEKAGTHSWSGKVMANGEIEGELDWIDTDGSKRSYTYSGTRRLK